MLMNVFEFQRNQLTTGKNLPLKETTVLITEFCEHYRALMRLPAFIFKKNCNVTF